MQWPVSARLRAPGWMLRACLSATAPVGAANLATRPAYGTLLCADVRLQVLGQIGAERLARIAQHCPDDTFDDPDGPDAVFVWEQRRHQVAPLLAEHGARLRWVHFRR